MASPDSRVIIVGAGVFGLSTALHLARGGYNEITVFDRCDFNKTHYDPARGCDGASADINKIFRTAYGKKDEYQFLAIEARESWLAWNQAIRESSASELPSTLSPDDKLLDVCGVYYLGGGKQMNSHYAESLYSLQKTAPTICDQQFIKDSAPDEQRISELGPKWHKKYRALDSLMQGNTHGFLDISGGVTLADKACVYAKFLCEKAGVRFVLGEPTGKLESLIYDETDAGRRVTGIRTCDGSGHSADLVVLACGSWTAAVLPEAHRTVEATTGSVLFIDVPQDRHDLRQKFHPDNFPVWHFRRGEMGSKDYYEGGGFPITSDGRLKFGFRGRKLTNFEDHPTQPKLRISTPWTRYSDRPCNTVPLYNLELMKEVLGQTFPELAELGFSDSRLCWYTDSVDNDFVIDYVPGYSRSVFICTGGSGHGFKFLPVLGKYVKNQLERRPDQFTQLWRWRSVEDGRACNGLELGEARDIKKHQLASPQDFKFQAISCAPTGNCH